MSFQLASGLFSALVTMIVAGVAYRAGYKRGRKAWEEKFAAIKSLARELGCCFTSEDPD